jgi:hypothetical protein
MFKRNNEPLADTLQDKRSDYELNHLIYAAATAITEEINGTVCYKSNTQPQKYLPGLGKYRSV